jgi:hypothetical protein
VKITPVDRRGEGAIRVAGYEVTVAHRTLDTSTGVEIWGKRMQYIHYGIQTSSVLQVAQAILNFIEPVKYSNGISCSPLAAMDEVFDRFFRNRNDSSESNSRMTCQKPFKRGRKCQRENGPAIVVRANKISELRRVYYTHDALML